MLQHWFMQTLCLFIDKDDLCKTFVYWAENHGWYPFSMIDTDYYLYTSSYYWLVKSSWIINVKHHGTIVNNMIYSNRNRNWFPLWSNGLIEDSIFISKVNNLLLSTFSRSRRTIKFLHPHNSCMATLYSSRIPTLQGHYCRVQYEVTVNSAQRSSAKIQLAPIMFRRYVLFILYCLNALVQNLVMVIRELKSSSAERGTQEYLWWTWVLNQPELGGPGYVVALDDLICFCSYV